MLLAVAIVAGHCHHFGHKQRMVGNTLGINGKRYASCLSRSYCKGALDGEHGHVSLRVNQCQPGLTGERLLRRVDNA